MPTALATPYEVLYDANTDGVFPEDLGWDRWTTGGGAARTVENGLCTLTAQNPSPNGGSDQYLWDAMETLNPDPGEMFYAEWRMRLLPGSNNSDVVVFIAPDGMLRDFHLQYSVFGMLSTGDAREVFMDMTVFRVFRVESTNMIEYSMFIDGQFAWDGFFRAGTTRSSEVRFGDGLVASASGSQWDYFRFGVRPVPVPRSVGLLVFWGLASVRWRKKYSFNPKKEDHSCTAWHRFWSQCWH